MVIKNLLGVKLSGKYLLYFHFDYIPKLICILPRLRLFSIIPFVLSLVTARRLLHLPRQIHTASSTLTLVTHILIINPFLLALSPTVLLSMLISSLPFVTLIFRLLLFGYGTKLEGATGGWEWHLQAWANWAIMGTLAIWLWSWAVARGIMRTTCSSVVGAWYFAEYVLFFRFGSPSTIHHCFLALPPQYHRQHQHTLFTLRSCGVLVLL